MFNFTKKYSHALVASNEKIAGMSEKYDAAIEKIERLEDELSQKTYELKPKLQSPRDNERRRKKMR